VTLRILDSRGVETQGVGEVWVSSPYLFEGYAAGHSAQTQWRDGYLTVGELGQLDGQGNLWLKGRKTRMITIADQNVFPEEVEAVILAIDGIAQCAVIPVADALRGHRLIAVIGAADGHDQLSDISAICKAALGPMSTPKKVLFHPDFPMLASGKADLGAITQWVERQI
jgi:long-chain acyl-CoA synthetase